MTQEGIHFEVLADEGRGWSVQAVLDDLASAESLAHDIADTTKVLAVKVVRAGYDERTGQFMDREMLFLGERQPRQEGRRDKLDAGPVCRNPQELYTIASRRAIRRVLRSWLESRGVAPVELLHDFELYTKLENTGNILLSGVQRAAMVQSSGNVQARQRELFKLIENAAIRLRRALRTDQRLQLYDDVDALAQQASATAEDGVLLFNCAITEWLRDFEKPVPKVSALLDLIGRASDKAALAWLDDYATDFVADPAIIRHFLGEEAPLGDIVIRIAGVLADEPVPALEDVAESDAERDFRLLADLVRRRVLPKCRAALLRRLVRTLKTPRALTNRGAIAEARYCFELNRILHRPDGEYIGGPEMAEALEQRSERAITANAVARLTEGMIAPLDRVAPLLDLEPGIVGERNKTTLGEHVLAILSNAENRKLLLEPVGPPAHHMRNLAQVQARIAQSGFNERQRSQAIGLLDDICIQIMEREQILKKVASMGGDRISICVTLLRLCAGGTFTEGRAAERARGEALRLLQTPGFIERYLESVDGREEKKRRLMTLRELIDQARLPETPLTAAMAMAVE